MYAFRNKFSGLLLMLAMLMILAACGSGAGTEVTSGTSEANTDSSSGSVPSRC